MAGKRTDRNQSEIVEALRSIGATVAITSTLGKGFPDIVVGYRGGNYLIEIKDWQQIPSKRRLTLDESEFHAMWRGQVSIIETVSEAISLVSRGAVREAA